MIQAKTVLEAWDKTFETMDFKHLAQYLSDDFQFEDTTGELDNLENTKSWCVAGGLRINNFKTIRENEKLLPPESSRHTKINLTEIKLLWMTSLII